jgi:hypothetical protein
VKSGSGVHALSVRNISASGAFLEARPREHGDLAPGVAVDVTVSATVPAAEDEMINIDEVINIECRGRIARVQLRTPTSPSGFGITLEPKTADDQDRLEDLLSRLIALPASQRSIDLG